MPKKVDLDTIIDFKQPGRAETFSVILYRNHIPYKELAPEQRNKIAINHAYVDSVKQLLMLWTTGVNSVDELASFRNRLTKL